MLPGFFKPTFTEECFSHDRALVICMILIFQVVITDINDNPPEFKQPVLTLGVTRGTGYGTNILNLMV